MADPGFPGGDASPRAEVPTYYLANFFRKLQENEEILGHRGGARPSCPLDPPMETLFALIASNDRNLLFTFQPNYTQVASVCNSWRVYGDIDDAWQSITSIINWYGDNQGNFTQVAGPGQWNDADMVSEDICSYPRYIITSFVVLASM